MSKREVATITSGTTTQLRPLTDLAEPIGPQGCQGGAPFRCKLREDNQRISEFRIEIRIGGPSLRYLDNGTGYFSKLFGELVDETLHCFFSPLLGGELKYSVFKGLHFAILGIVVCGTLPVPDVVNLPMIPMRCCLNGWMIV